MLWADIDRAKADADHTGDNAAWLRAEIAASALRLREAVVSRDRLLLEARTAGLTLRELADASGLSVEGVRNRLTVAEKSE